MARTMRAMSEHNNIDPRLARVAPTWEVELLISGVAVFAMLQLPGWLDEHLLSLQPRLAREWHNMALMIYLYVKSAAVILAITFILHLGLRARWIALVGMNSVFPGGIRSERLKMGSVQRTVETGLNEPTEAVIERADNAASVVFAIGVMITSFVVSILLMVVGMYALSSAAINGLGLDADAYKWTFILLLLLLSPLLLAGLVDQWRGATASPDSITHRTLAAVFRTYMRVGMGRSSNRIMALLSSHGGERKALSLLMAVVMLTILGVSASLAAMRTPEKLGNYANFPMFSGEKSLDTSHYDDRRNPLIDDALPYVPSLVATGPYLELLVPYRPMRDEPAMRVACKHANGIANKNAREQARLDCLQVLHSVLLDGKPLADLHYEVSTDPRTARPALLAMIDIRDLPRGRHELRIARPPLADRKPDADKPDPGFDRILFWR